MKLKNTKLFLLPTISCLTVTPFLGITSCGVNAHEVKLATNSYIVNQHEFNFPVYFNFDPNSEVTIELVNNDEKLKLVHEKDFVKKGIINLFFQIDESLEQDYVFSFDIKFSYVDKNGNPATEKEYIKYIVNDMYNHNKHFYTN